MAAEHTAQNESIFQTLMQRRIPHFLGGYLFSSIAIVQFIDWLVKRYLWAPSWTDACIFLLALFIPSYLVLVFFHGKPGKDPWTQWEKVGIPCNLVVMVLLMWVLFGNKSFAPIAEKVKITDDQGNQVTKVVPQQQFRQKVGLYFFDNETGKPEIDWLQYGLNYLLLVDLNQDLFLEVSSPYNLPTYFKKAAAAGFTDGTRVPMTLQRKDARENYRDLFVRGSITGTNPLALDVTIHRTETGEQVAAIALTNTDPFALTDQLSKAMKKKLGIPDHYEGYIDLPTAEMVTSSEQALMELVLGLNGLQLDQDGQKGQAHFQKAADLDPTFSIVNFYLSQVSKGGGQNEAYAKAYDNAVKHMYRLPDRMQYDFRYVSYLLDGDYKNAMAMAEMILELYPQDPSSMKQRAFMLEVLGRKDEAIHEYRKMYELRPEEHEFLIKLADLSLDLGKNDQALDFYVKYLDKSPRDRDALIKMAKLYAKTGKFSEATAIYEKIRMIDPNDFQTLSGMIDLEIKRRNYDLVLERCAEVYARTEHADEQIKIFITELKIYRDKGQLGKLLDRERAFRELIDSRPIALETVQHKSSLSYLLFQMGKYDRALSILDSVAETIPQIKPQMAHLYAKYYSGKGDLENAKRELGVALSFGREQNHNYYLASALEVKGLIEEREEQYQTAIETFLEVIERDPEDQEVFLSLARCYRKRNDNAQARNHIEKALLGSPHAPTYNLEAARVAHQGGDPDQAMSYLERAMQVWKDADPEFVPAQEARDLKTTWQSRM